MVIAGIAGSVLGAADIFDLSGSFAAKVSPAMLTLLGVVAQFLFLERFEIEELRRENRENLDQVLSRLSEMSGSVDGAHSELRDGIAGLRGELLRLSPVRILTSATELYATARRLADVADRVLRSTSCGFSDEIRFKPYIDAIAARARVQSDAGRDFRYITVFGGDLSEEKCRKKVKIRLDAFENAGVKDRLAMLRLKGHASLGVDLLVVDDVHLLVTFLSHDNNLRNGLVVENSPEFVKSVVSWYDHTLCATMADTYEP